MILKLTDALFHACKAEQVIRWAHMRLVERPNHQITDTNNMAAGLQHVYELQKVLKKALDEIKQQEQP